MTFEQIFICKPFINWALFICKTEQLTFNAYISTNTKILIVWIKELVFCRRTPTPIFIVSEQKLTISLGTGATDNIKTSISGKNAKYLVCLKVVCPFKKSQTFWWFGFHCRRQITESHSDKSLAKNLPPRAAMRELVRWRSRTHTSWMIIYLWQKLLGRECGVRSTLNAARDFF